MSQTKRNYNNFDDENLNRAAEAVRQSQNIKRARAAVSPEIIDSYFEELSETLKDVPPEAIINYDETSMQDNPGKSKVNVHRSCKYPERIIDFSKSNFSVMFASTTSGVALSSYVVYKADHLYSTWTEGGPAGTRYNRSKSGWFEGNIFEEWFETIALPYMKKLCDCPKAIIGDNLASHISVRRLPQVSQAEDDSASAARWTSSFEEFLKNTREKETKVNPRRKKITVTPGKSLTERNVIEELRKNETAQKRREKENHKKVTHQARRNKRKASDNGNCSGDPADDPEPVPEKRRGKKTMKMRVQTKAT
ncbi:hypothetical protein ANN_24147 [Periplaneta americana]|uniref:DDE-1 domain-containing protein n=1 Tax=Periplaneta americana TaxID=6978 RepID=A0ABQ8S2H6_PERAM|nr:hypothetical protein ANN_24147 [Periplaneta americana]